MDLDHLKKLVDAAIEEGEQHNCDGPAYAELVDYVTGGIFRHSCDTGLLRAAGYNAGVYREAIAKAIEFAKAETGQ